MATFFPWELYEETTWEVYDPGLARIVAVFYNKEEAEAFLAASNSAGLAAAVIPVAE